MSADVYDFAALLAGRSGAAARAVTAAPAPPSETEPYVRAALEQEAAAVRDAPAGTRNATLNRAAFNLSQLAAGGHLTQELVDSTLRAAALSAGLDPGEVEATLRSGARGGAQYPRQVEAAAAIAPTIIDLPAYADGEGPAAGELAAEPEQRQRSTWWPTPVLDRVSADDAAPVPVFLWRDDETALWYSGKVNGLIGESESGKSWVALLAVAQALREGYRVLFLDFEDSASSIAGRLRTVGVTEAEIAGFDYASPAEQLGPNQSADLAEGLARGPALIIVDGVNAAMTLLGLDLHSNGDATAFALKVLRPLAATGACVATVDHVPKNPDARGKGGIGAQAKRAMVDGALLRVEVAEPFGVGQNGSLKLFVDKDRPGRVRGSAQGNFAGRVRVTSTASAITLTVLSPHQVAGGGQPEWQPTHVMEELSRVVEAGAGPSFRTLDQLVGGRAETKRKALAVLVAEGYVRVETGPRNASRHVSVRPYREAGDPRSDRFEAATVPPCPTVSERATGHGVRDRTTVSHPLRGDTVRTHSRDTDAVECVPTAEAAPEDGWADCNGCGERFADAVLARGDGYCLDCAKARQ